MMKKMILTALAAALMGAAGWAVPAKRVTTTVTQPDGTQLTITAVGDEFHHGFVTTDGLAVARDAAGAYCYVTADGLTATVAHNPAARGSAEQSYVAGNKARLAFSATATAAQTSRRAAARKKVGSTQVPNTGSPRVPILLVQYSDKKMSNSKQTFVSQYSSGSKSAYQYFKDQSNGKFTPQFDVYGIYTLPSTRATYGGNDSSGNDKGVCKMVIDAISKAGNDVDWSQYDNDGDGQADVCIVVYAGVGEAQASTTVSSSIWPCQWNLSDGAKSGDGTGAVKLNGTTIDKFAVFNEVNGSSDSGTRIDGVGTFCHEFSHCLGLPDFYETTYSNGYYGMGSWSLMDYGSYNNNGYTPIGYDAYEKNFMGWLDLVTPQENTKYSLPVFNQKSEATDVALKITSDLNSNEYFILENRAKQGWDQYINDEGVMITHVTYVESRWSNNSPNNRSVQLMTIMPADNQLTSSTETADLYGESNHSFTDSSTPAAKLNMRASGSLASSTGGAGSLGKPVTEINLANDGTATLWYMKGTSTEPTEPTTLGVPQASATSIASTSFRAQWSLVEGAATYNLQVNKHGTEQPSGASTVTFAPGSDKGTYSSLPSSGNQNDQVSKDGITITATKGAFAASPYRLGKGSVNTFSSTAGNITSIELTCASNYPASGFAASSGWTLSGTTAKWTGNASQVSISSSNKQVRLSAIKVTYGSSNAPAKAASETGDADSRTITGIASTYYDVKQLTAGATYDFKVQAVGASGNTGDWSDTKQVTLTQAPVTTPELIADPETVTLAAMAGQTATGKFSVLGSELNGNVTLTLTDPNKVFALGSTTVSKASAEDGADVAVTFAPKAAGTFTATVTVASTGAQPVTVTLSGTATAAPVPEVIADPNKVTVTAQEGQRATGKFSVLGSELTGDVTLTLTDPSKVFTLGSATIARAAALEGADVSFTFAPAKAGTYAARVVVSTPGAKSDTVTLSGTATAAPITSLATPVMQSADTASVTTSSFKASWTQVENALTYTLQVSKSDSTEARTITGITTNSCTVNQLQSGATYAFKVQAVGKDSLRSDWSNTQQVTLKQETKPLIKASDSALTLTAEADESVTYNKFTVTGTNLSEGITLTLNDPDGGFMISPENIGADKANGANSVQITFMPQSEKIYTATLTLASKGAQSVTVKLNGVGTASTKTPRIISAADTLRLTSYLSKTKGGTLPIYCSHLNGDVKVTLKDGSGVFKVLPTTIAKDEANGLSTLVVQFTPKARRTYNGTITLSSTDAEDVKVQLVGAVVAQPVIKPVNTTLSLEATELSADSCQGQMKASNLVGNVLLEVKNDDEGVFSVSPAFIAQDSAANFTFTVRFTPKAAKAYTATLVATSVDADDVTITLNGQGLPPEAPQLLPADTTALTLTSFRADWNAVQAPCTYTLQVDRYDEAAYNGPVDVTFAAGTDQGEQSFALFQDEVSKDGVLIHTAKGAFKASPYRLGKNAWTTFTAGKGKITKIVFNCAASGTAKYGPGCFSLPATGTYTYAGTVGTWTGEADTVRFYTASDQVRASSIVVTYKPQVVIEDDGKRTFTFTGITSNAYAVTGLTSGGTYDYKVRAIYSTGAVSDWSQVQRVTLRDVARPVQVGDVNMDGVVNANDVSTLANYVLGQNPSPCDTAACDVNADGTINSNDVAALISLILGI